MKTYESFSNEIQSYYAGYLEGYIYHELIGFHYTNIYKTLFHNKDLPEDLVFYMKKQEEFYRNLMNGSEDVVAKDNCGNIFLYLFFISQGVITFQGGICPGKIFILLKLHAILLVNHINPYDLRYIYHIDSKIISSAK